MAGLEEPHGPVLVVVMDRALGRVNRQRLVVRAHAVTVRDGVGEDARLQDLVRRESDAPYDVRGGEGGLLPLGEVVLRVAVQLHHAYVDQRVVAVGPDLGEAARVALSCAT